jgi:hypothetical protein
LCQKSVLPDMRHDLSTETKRPVLARLRRRYATAGPNHKTQLLDQAVELLGDHHQAGIRAPGHGLALSRSGTAAGPAQDVSSGNAAADYEADLVHRLPAVWESLARAVARMAASLRSRSPPPGG